MILSGAQITSRGLVQNLRQVAQQQQSCGVDLTLRHVSRWTSAASLDFDNTQRQAAATTKLTFDASDTIMLRPGAYLIDFNETVQVPQDCMATIFPRSSLWRAGVGLGAGLVDAGYQGALGALLDVKNPNGINLYRGAKVAQIMFEHMAEEVPGYNGVYQFSESSVGLDGSKRTSRSE
jgi:dUTP pyrophosphatase